MWHEARRREKATQKLLNDHKKRAEKRREENKIDPNSLLQVNGLKAKLHLDSSIYKQAKNSLVAWQGDKSITIDRFDVRATLSSIPTVEEPTHQQPSSSKNNTNEPAKNISVIDADENETTKKLLNYERFRLLIQNDCNKNPEESRLKLVSKSDHLTSAKYRKLKYNKFGTLGETSVLSQDSNSGFSSLTSRLLSQSMKKEPVAGPYSSVPPPPSLLGGRYETELCPPYQEDIKPKVMDLNEFESYDIDEVNFDGLENNKLNDIANRFGFSPEELLVLAREDGQDLDLAELLKMMTKLSERKRKEKSFALLSDHRNFYGPALPPDTAPITVKHEPISPQSDEDIFNRTSIVQQRSPSGGQIPLRRSPSQPHPSELEGLDGRRASFHDSRLSRRASQEEAVIKKLKPDPEESGGCLQQANSSGYGLDDEDNLRPKKPVLEAVLEKISKVGAEMRSAQERRASFHLDHLHASPVHIPGPIEMPLEPELPPRRASTPLIYKRTCRSSRSVSRDRNHHHHHHHHHQQQQQQQQQQQHHHHHHHHHHHRPTSRRRSSSRSCTSGSFSSPGSTTSSRSPRHHSSRLPRRQRASRSRSFSRSSACSSVFSPRPKRRRRGPGRSRRRRRRRRNRRK